MMHALIEQVNSMGRGFVEFAWPMLMQSSVLILVLLLADILLRRKVRAVFRYWLWMLIFVKLVLPTSLSSPVSIGQVIGEPVAAIKITVAAQAPADEIRDGQYYSPLADIVIAPQELPFALPVHSGQVAPAVDSTGPTVSLTWQGGVFLLWLVVVLAMFLLLLQRAFFVFGLVRQAKEANGLMKDMLRFCGREIGVKGEVGLKVSPNATSPAVCGLFRPVILLPHGIGSNLGSSQFRTVLMHELAHIRRGDLWVNLLQTLLQIAYFYNPLLWVANWVIRRVREQAVDEAVQVAMGEKAGLYPETLLNVARLAFERPALSLRLIGVVESKSALTGRINRMLNRPVPRSAKLGIIGLAVVCLIGAILVPMAKASSRRPEFVIRGTVIDSQTGKPIAGAKVGDVEQYADGEQMTFTDANGNYSYKTWYEEHDVKAEADGYKRQEKVLVTKLFGSEKDKKIDFSLESKLWYMIDFEVVEPQFPEGDSIEITEIVGTAKKLRPGERYTVRGNYKLSSCDEAMLHLYATNGETRCEQNSNVTRGQGQFERTVDYLKEGGLHLSFYPAEGGSSFGGVYFTNKGIEIYEVNRSVSEFEQEDFSTPEAAYASINRVSASGGPEEWQRVSIKKLAERLAGESKKGKTDVDPEWASVLLNARILEVRIWNGTDAVVFAELPQAFSSKPVRSQIDIRHLKLEDGRWLNAGNDRVWTIEEARAIGDGKMSLESRVEVIEEQPIISAAEFGDKDDEIAQRRARLQNNVDRRMSQDRAVYTQQELTEIESLYQVANKGFNKEAQESLEKLVARHEKANRTGCAVLYLGQMAAGAQKERYLKRAIEKHNDCWYGDGVQVGAYARYHLAMYYHAVGRQEEAAELFAELRRDFPNAIDHKGEFLFKLIPADMNKAGIGPPRNATVELKYDDGKQAGKQSIAGSGHCVKFETPKEGGILKAVKIYGSRYGEYEPPEEDFYVWLCGTDFEVIREFAFPYAHFQIRGLAKWVTLAVEPTKLPQDFIVCVGFNPHQSKGIYMYYDAQASGNSFTGLPGGELGPFEKGDWMIRAVVAEDSERSEAAPAPVKSGLPVVVKTTPEVYANDVSPDLREITVTFNQQMTDKSWSWVQWGAPYPETTDKPYYDDEKKTCTLPVKLQQGQAYLVAFNIESFVNFINVAGEPAKPYVLVFATKGKDGKPTPIPEELIAKAKSVNERSEQISSNPEAETSGAESVPYTQIMYDDIQPDGTILFRTTVKQVNRTGRELSKTGFINSKFVEVTGMSDGAGRKLKFTTKDGGEHWQYEVLFNEPIGPGEVMEYSHEGRLTGLISKAPDAEKEYIYHFRHWPSAGEITRRVETYLLPAEAKLISTTPEDMDRREKEGRIELHIEEMVPAGGSIMTSFRYLMP